LPDWNAPPFRLYWKGAVPAEAVTVRVVVPPKQAITPADVDTVGDGGCAFTVILVIEDIQPLPFFALSV
jgi:hypothetical protein